MFLFIFESIGTSELILIGIIALIFLGPRKLPSIAKTIGKTMADLRNTTNEFKSTWEREVDFEEEAKAWQTGDVNSEPMPREDPRPVDSEPLALPEIKPADNGQFAEARENGGEPEPVAPDSQREDATSDEPGPAVSEKSTWL